MIWAIGLALMLHAKTDDGGFVMSGPAEAKTIKEILTCAEKDSIQIIHSEKPNVSTVEYSGQVKAFVAWYCPYSGRAACHVYIYVHDPKKGVWVRKVASEFEKTHTVSVEVGHDGIKIRDVNGKVVHREPAKAEAEK